MNEENKLPLDNASAEMRQKAAAEGISTVFEKGGHKSPAKVMRSSSLEAQRPHNLNQHLIYCLVAKSPEDAVNTELA